MKAIVLYATRYGSTHVAAERIAAALGGAEICELNALAPAPEGYDAVIIGAPVYMGQLLKPARAYLAAHEQALLRARLGLFACGATRPGENGFPGSAFPEALRGHAQAICAAGGLVKPGSMRALDRFVTNMIVRSGDASRFTQVKIDNEAIERFAKALQG